MANHPSALKRHRQSEKRRLRHKSTKSALRTLLKKVRSAATKEEALKQLSVVTSRLHKAAQTGSLHKNNASRKISRLTQFVNRLS